MIFFFFKTEKILIFLINERMTDDSHCKYFYTTSTVYLRKKRSKDIKFALQPNPVGGALTGTDQCGLLVETQELWESAG